MSRSSEIARVRATLAGSQLQKTNYEAYQSILQLINGVEDLDSQVSGLVSIVTGGSIVDPAQLIQIATVELTDADIKALPTIPFELVPAPGTGLILDIISCHLYSDFTAGAYTNINLDSWLFGIHGDFPTNFIANDSAIPLTFLTRFLGAISSYVKLVDYMYSQPIFSWGNISDIYAYATVLNASFTLNFENNGTGNLTGGNAANFLKVVTKYQTVEFP